MLGTQSSAAQHEEDIQQALTTFWGPRDLPAWHLQVLQVFSGKNMHKRSGISFKAECWSSTPKKPQSGNSSPVSGYGSQPSSAANKLVLMATPELKLRSKKKEASAVQASCCVPSKKHIKTGQDRLGDGRKVQGIYTSCWLPYNLHSDIHAKQLKLPHGAPVILAERPTPQEYAGSLLPGAKDSLSIRCRCTTCSLTHKVQPVVKNKLPSVSVKHEPPCLQARGLHRVVAVYAAAPQTWCL